MCRCWSQLAAAASTMISHGGMAEQATRLRGSTDCTGASLRNEQG